MILIEHEDNGTRGRFFVKERDEYLAQMVYIWSGKDKIIVEHTEVDERLKGQSVGTQLLSELAAWVREQGIKVVPVCPFVKAIVEKKPDEYNDILYKIHQ
ncbi:MAG: N-acetyltransferase [Bacteroidetes bacterium]|nr:N-acetyltransferase [Bacteroidota bacterium]